jgi:hypothetical protein
MGMGAAMHIDAAFVCDQHVDDVPPLAMRPRCDLVLQLLHLG